MADKKQNAVKYGEIIAKCWEDEAFKKRFLEDPEGVLTEAGVVLEEGVTYKVIEAPKLVEYLVLPQVDTRAAVHDLTRLFLNKVEKTDVMIPEGTEVRIIQNTDDMRYLILPVSPKALSKAELAKVAGGDEVQSEVSVYETVVESTTEATTTATTVEVGMEVVACGVVVVI